MSAIDTSNKQNARGLIVVDGNLITFNPHGAKVLEVQAHEAGRIAAGLLHLFDGRVDETKKVVFSARNANVAYRYDPVRRMMVELMRPMALGADKPMWNLTGRVDPGYQGPDGANTHTVTSHLAALLFACDDACFVCPATEQNLRTVGLYQQLIDTAPADRDAVIKAYSGTLVESEFAF